MWGWAELHPWMAFCLSFASIVVGGNGVVAIVQAICTAVAARAAR